MAMMVQLRRISCIAIAVWLVLGSSVTVAGRRMREKALSDQEAAHETLRLCPRNLENVDTGYRKCMRPCVTDADCKGKKKKCLCDGDCGMTCVKPNTKCAPLIDPSNGKVHTTGIEAFGAKVFYTCQQDFRLKGPRARSCQGDGTWSGDAPACQPDVKCEHPQEIKHAQHNADWRLNQYELDTMILYTCESGYAIDGFARAKCIYFNGTAKWFGPDLRCVARDCGHPADITNGYREGDHFHYPHRVKFHCYPGYNLIGKAIRHCQRNGKWDGENPVCKAVECLRPVDPYNGFAVISSLKYESAVTYTCKPGYQLVRGGERRCQANQTWSGPEPKCEVVNCGPPVPIINGGYNGSLTTFNSVIFYYCNKGMKFVGMANSAKCQADGKWSHPAPDCFASCVVPHIEHGSANGSPGDNVSHGDLLNVSCVPKYELTYSTTSPKCHNGSFLHVPTCQPASCKSPPPNPRRGLVIAPKTDHGMKARFVCNKGFRIVGEDTVICDYGNWSGVTPLCQEIYCPWPGKLGNGTIYLVGAMGSYEYFDYIKTVIQDRQIRYECTKGYFIQGGPAGATCVDGNWSPIQKPKCVQAPCSDLKSEHFEQSNVLRDAEDAAHYIASIKCRAGFVANVPNGNATCRNGEWKPRKPDCLPLTCRVPDTMNGQFRYHNKTISAWTELEDSASIKFFCIAGYQISGPQKLLCSTGQFIPPTIPECVPASCLLPDIDFGTYTGGYRNGLRVAHNSMLGWNCADGYRKSPISAVRCDLGRLTPNNPTCLSTRQDNLVKSSTSEQLQGCSSPENLNSSEVFPTGTELEMHCYLGSDLTTLQSWKIVCVDGSWRGENNASCRAARVSPAAPPAVTDNRCAIPKVMPHVVAYLGERRLDLGDARLVSELRVNEKSELMFHCEHLGMFRLLGPSRLTCVAGVWDGMVPRCEDLRASLESPEGLNGPPAIEYHKTSGIIGTGKTGELLVYPSTDLQLDCLWKRTDGTPSWTASHQFRVYPKGWAGGSGDDRDQQFRLSIYHAVKDDSGIFTCMTPRGNAHSIVIKVQVVECPLVTPFATQLLANTSSTRMGTNVAFNCSRGYRLDGPKRLQCQPTGNWSDRIPGCVPITCPLINVTDARLRLYSNSRDVGSMVEYACAQGFRLRGPATSRCEESGKWSSEVPNCEEISCSVPGKPERGSVSAAKERFLVGEEVEYSCDPGYALIGSETVSCLDSGQWSEEPVCAASCNYPGHPLHGRISAPWVLKFHYDIGENVGFECDSGFVLSGSLNMTCLNNGRWSSELPLCIG